MEKLLQSIMKGIPFLVLGAFVLGAFLFMIWSADEEASIIDEPSFIASGYGYVKYFDHQPGAESPPLMSIATAFPLIFFDLNFPADLAGRASENNSHDLGQRFLYGAGNDADAIIRTSRLVSIFFTLLLIIFVYGWAREITGRRWALLAAFFTAFSPVILAFGHYATADLGGTFGIFIAIFAFVRFLFNPTQTRLILAGFFFGIAQAMTFKALVLIPFFAFLALVSYFRDIAQDWRSLAREGRLKKVLERGVLALGRVFAVLIIGIAFVVYPLYFVATLNYSPQKQTSDTSAILNASEQLPNGFEKLNIAMSEHRIFRPLAAYTLDVLSEMQHSSENDPHYFFGEVRDIRKISYFPLIYLLKEPIPLLFLTFIAFLASAWGIAKSMRNGQTRFMNYLGTSFPEFTMITFVIFYLIWSITSPLDIGYRHLLPVLPFIYILTANALRRWLSDIMLFLPQSGTAAWYWFKILFGQSMKFAILIACVGWLIAETIAGAPYFISYFNEFGGSTKNGYRYAVHSNYDLGQDMLRLQKWINENPDVDRIAIDYFGAERLSYYFADKAENWWSARGNPAEQGIYWFAVSVNSLQGAIQPKAEGVQRKAADEYRWLTAIRPAKDGMGGAPEPDARIGTSIFIYKLN